RNGNFVREVAKDCCGLLGVQSRLGVLEGTVLQKEASYRTYIQYTHMSSSCTSRCASIVPDGSQLNGEDFEGIPNIHFRSSHTGQLQAGKSFAQRINGRFKLHLQYICGEVLYVESSAGGLLENLHNVERTQCLRPSGHESPVTG